MKPSDLRVVLRWRAALGSKILAVEHSQDQLVVELSLVEEGVTFTTFYGEASLLV